MKLKDFRKSLKGKVGLSSAFSILLALLVLNFLAWLIVYDLSRTDFLEVTFFDIGQGDAIFIETPQKYQILIDGGPNSTILEKIDKELPFWDNTLDLIILTHPEHDHLLGLLEVLKRYQVENILWTGVQRETAEFQEWQRLIKKEEREGTKIKIVQAHQKINLSIYEIDRFLEILWPLENLAGQEVNNVNNTSVVVKLVFGENSFLFTGDVYKSVEREFVDREVDIDSDILKVSHHGSKTSSDEVFIREVSPEIAVISCGKDNPYGHPHPETLETLEKYGINTLRTDINGDIKIISNRNKLTPIY
jgi:competence protein ComEC